MTKTSEIQEFFKKNGWTVSSNLCWALHCLMTAKSSVSIETALLNIASSAAPEFSVEYTGKE